MIHGVLHLCGYDDHEEEDILRIREEEEAWLRELSKE
jgi:ssRNA-specific RNase YbeY (16S rRNA maturation enzyme)